MRARYIPLLLFLAARPASAAPSDFVGNEAPQPLPAPLAAAIARIDAGTVARHIDWLAAPAREGRGLGTRGLEATAAYLAGQLQGLGLRAEFQRVPLRKVAAPGGSVTLRRAGAAPLVFEAWQSAVPPALAPQTIEGAVVDAAYGIREPGLGRDDFAGLDVRGKVVLLRSGVPPGAEWQTAELIDRYAFARAADRYDTRLTLLKTLGAKAVIAVEPDPPDRPEPWYLAASGPPKSGEPPLARIKGTLPFLPAREEREASPLSATIRITGVVRAASSRNVIGVLEGSDPVLRSQAVVVGAHMDHLGMAGGVLYPGADDNAAGVAALLEVARAFATGDTRPRRTLVFVFWTGEEAGQLGSSYYVHHPAWPLARTTAYVNFDMIAHPWTRGEIEKLVAAEGGVRADALLAQAQPSNFAEAGVAKGSPGLLAALATAARGTGMVLHFDRTDGVDGGSDYRAFARRGVPFIRFFGDYFPGYHQPEDRPEGLDPAQVVRMARLALATVWLLAEPVALPASQPAQSAKRGAE